MKTVCIGFSRPKGFKPGAWAIQVWQGFTPYSHVYLKVYSGYTGQSLVYQASHGDVHCIEYENFLKANYVVREFELGIDDEDLRSTIKKAQKMLQSPYGYVGLFRLVISRVFDRILPSLSGWGDGQRSYHCSELILRLFPKIADDMGLNPDHVDPRDLFNYLRRTQPAEH